MQKHYYGPYGIEKHYYVPYGIERHYYVPYAIEKTLLHRKKAITSLMV